MRSYALLTFALVAGPAIAGPANVPAKFIKESWTIQAELPNGKFVNLLVSPTRKETFITEEALGEDSYNGSIDLKFGDVVLKGIGMTSGQMLAKYPDQSTDKLDGFLGQSALEKIAVGLDVKKAKWSVWQGGSVQDAEAKNWLRSVPGWDTVKTDRLQFDKGRPYLTWTLRPDPVKMFLDFAVNWSYLPKFAYLNYQASKVRDEPLLEEAKTELSVFNEAPPWLSVNWLLVSSTYIDEFVGTQDGRISLDDLLSPKMILDLPGKKLWRVSAKPETQRCASVSKLVGLPFATTDGSLVIGDVDLQPVSDGLRKIQGNAVLSIGGIESKEIVKRLIQSDKLDWPFLIELGRATAKDFKLIVEYEGKPVSITISRRG